MGLNRRHFLQGGAALSLAGHGGLQAQPAYRGRRLLVVMLRGGMDSLTAVPVVGDPKLADLRGGLLPARPLPLAGDYAMHPRLAQWHRAWTEGQAAVVHATSFAYTGRSHFEGQDIMQSGITSPYASNTGWLGRAMQASGLGGGVSISIPMPLLLRGHPGSDTRYSTWLATPPPQLVEAVTRRWSADPALAPYAEPVAAPYRGMDSAGMVPPQAQPFAQTRTPRALAQAAGEAMRANEGPMVGLVDLHGFDTHASQGAAEGTHADRLAAVDQVLEGYREAIGERWRDCLVVTLTEFGRTVAENGTTGTDHGWGSCILMAGGLVARAQVHADWPGLGPQDLFEKRDLRVTTDAAAVYAQVVSAVLGLPPERIARDVLAFNARHWRDGMLRT